MTELAFLGRAGGRIHYRLAGKGCPAIVLVHGGFCCLTDWDRQFDALAKDHTVLAPDLRGHGHSTGDFARCTVEGHAADILALVDALGIETAVLVGHSFGSRVVAQAAHDRPDVVAGVVLLDGSRSHGGFAATERQPDALPMPATLDEVLDATIGPHADGETRARIKATMAAAPAGLMQVTIDTMRDWDIGRADAVVAGIAPTIPLLAIQSTYHDQFTPRRCLSAGESSTPYLAFLRQARPDLQVRILHETGHFSMLERPDTVTALILGFAMSLKP